MTTEGQASTYSVKSRAELWLLVRMDRIGDVVLTLPSDQLGLGIKAKWVISPSTEFILKASVPLRQYHTIIPDFNWPSFWKTVRWFKNERASGVIFFQAPIWMYWAALFARIPRRLGPLSKISSFLCLNEGTRQKRSSAEKHESEYNLDIVRWRLNPAIEFAPLQLIAPRALVKAIPKNYVVIHAGMAGSARNWRAENYAALIRLLSGQYEIIMTGTAMDSSYLAPLKLLTVSTHLHWWNERLTASELLTVLAGARAVIAPSTGVVHLAASLGVPTLGIFSPVKVQAPLRWSPRGPRAVYMVATDVAPASFHCPGHFHCLMEKCPHFDCMNLITPSAVAEWVRSNAHQPE